MHWRPIGERRVAEQARRSANHRGGILRAVYALTVAFVGYWPSANEAACAGLTLSPLVIDLPPDQTPGRDIELLNDSGERIYVVVDPSEIVQPGTSAEQRVQSPDPQELGLLATPNRLILEPGQRKFVRLVMLKAAGDMDRVFRVTIKPVIGGVDAPTTGVKILVGYDLLVIQRPKLPRAHFTATRTGTALVLENDGNTSAELFAGNQCNDGRVHCTQLPGHRLYAGASWTVTVEGGAKVNYRVKIGGVVSEQHF